jgi:hypothetical protein
MAHLTPEQFVDIADGVLPESGSEVARHLSTCVECRQQLADMRAVMTEAVADDVVDVPEPSPLFWDHLSARVRDAVAEEPVPRSWRERLLQPWVLVPSLASAIAAASFVVLLPRPAVAPAKPALPPSIIQTTAIPAGSVSLPALDDSMPLAAADPQLGLVADYTATLSWDEMRDEVALSESAASSDAVFDVLTADEQREVQRLLADEMARLAPQENRS